MSKPCLFGVGVGPGDPELMTVKAIRIIGSSDVIAYPTNIDGQSLALNIARNAISEDSIHLPIYIPMKVEREPAVKAYESACQKIDEYLRLGRSVAYICEGDPLFYGSFTYIHSILKSQYCIEIVPGVSSIMACSAVSGVPLARRNDTFKIIPATAEIEKVKQALQQEKSIAIIKIGRHYENIKCLLEELNLTDRAMVIEAATTGSQNIGPVSEYHESKLPYFSTILVNRGEHKQ